MRSAKIKLRPKPWLPLGAVRGAGVAQGSVSLSLQPDHMLGYPWPPQTGVPQLQDTCTQSCHSREHEQTAPAATRQRVPAGLLDILNFKTVPKELKFPPLYYICIYCAISIPSSKACSMLFFICFQCSTLLIYSVVILTYPLASPGTCSLNSPVSPSLVTRLCTAWMD